MQITNNSQATVPAAKDNEPEQTVIFEDGNNAKDEEPKPETTHQQVPKPETTHQQVPKAKCGWCFCFLFCCCWQNAQNTESCCCFGIAKLICDNCAKKEKQKKSWETVEDAIGSFIVAEAAKKRAVKYLKNYDIYQTKAWQYTSIEFKDKVADEAPGIHAAMQIASAKLDNQMARKQSVITIAKRFGPFFCALIVTLIAAMQNLTLPPVYKLDRNEIYRPFNVSSASFIYEIKAEPGPTDAWGAAALSLSIASAFFAALFLQYLMGEHVKTTSVSNACVIARILLVVVIMMVTLTLSIVYVSASAWVNFGGSIAYGALLILGECLFMNRYNLCQGITACIVKNKT